ncbi:hypothetical protein WICPIJ_006088 [Wickerhamomyces pijperi]|uniref:Uncharacterized protein n=1 Tax=Wickerhamomyces pijperi TaxID=599730 RepID=A0A9P8Q520_WICPI|nr:hypothetical protein WICPIJ_006088 [Wickerhamomyces pijperi]
MGTCLAVIKIIGTTSLGIYTGTVFSNQLTSLDILKKSILRNTENAKPLEIIKEHLTLNSIVLGIFGSLSTFAFQLSFFGAPVSLKHPYLIYSSLVFPISAAIFISLNCEDLIRLINFESLILDSDKKETKTKKAKKEKKQLRSDLDNSVYKDLGESNSEEEGEEDLAAVEEDEEINNEVEAHLEKATALKVVENLKLSNSIVLGVSLTGLLITAIGLYGDH